MTLLKKVFAALLMITLLGVGIGCNRGQSVIAQTADDRERTDIVQSYTKTMFITCGEKLYAGSSPNSSYSWFKGLYGYRQYKNNPTVHVDEAKLKEVDKLNGIERAFEISVLEGVNRSSNEGRWGDWVEGGDLIGGTTFIKRNGRWFVASRASVNMGDLFGVEQNNEIPISEFWSKIHESIQLPTCDQIGAIR